jgi:hypothetical protein
VIMVKLVYVCAHSVSEAGTLFVDMIQSLCDLPHAATKAYDQIPQLRDKLLEIAPPADVEHMCEYFATHVGYYIQYVTYPDHYTLISWSHVTKKFLEHHAFDRTFCDLWRAHVHLLMLHAQASWSKKWDQEQSCWFRHNDVCDLLKTQFEIWLKEKSFDSNVTIN